MKLELNSVAEREKEREREKLAESDKWANVGDFSDSNGDVVIFCVLGG